MWDPHPRSRLGCMLMAATSQNADCTACSTGSQLISGILATTRSDVQVTSRCFVFSKTPWLSSAYDLPFVYRAATRQCMAISHSRIKTIKVTCDRFKQMVEGIQSGNEFTAGFFDMTKWEEFRREDERYVCDSCMFADPKYLERYGSCF